MKLLYSKCSKNVFVMLRNDLRIFEYSLRPSKQVKKIAVRFDKGFSVWKPLGESANKDWGERSKRLTTKSLRLFNRKN